MGKTKKKKAKKMGRPKGSGLGKYGGEKAKAPPSVRKWWREQYHKRKRKKRK